MKFGVVVVFIEWFMCFFIGRFGAQFRFVSLFWNSIDAARTKGGVYAF